jgi:hypothetical protein
MNQHYENRKLNGHSKQSKQPFKCQHKGLTWKLYIQTSLQSIHFYSNGVKKTV